MSDDTFPALPGLDSIEGLRRMMGRPALYERVLRDFAQRFAERGEPIRAALAAGDPETAARLAHSAKGLAGSISAPDLQAAALTLETTIKQGEDATAALAVFEAAMDTVLDGIRAAFPAA